MFRSHQVIMVVLCGLLCSLPACAQTLLQTFTLREMFGVSHQSQLVELPLNQDVTSAYLQNDTAQEVPYQVVSGGTYGHIVFISDLPAFATRNYYLYDGMAPSPVTNPVVVDGVNPDYYEITNGLTGIRVPKVYAPLTITPKAPIQGIRFRDGTWSPPATNITLGYLPWYPITSTDTMTVTFKEIGPLKVIVEVRYDCTTPANYYGATLVRPAGAGHYTTTIEVQKDQPSMLFEVDTDLFSTYNVSLYAGVQPTQLRYKGHHATDPIYGHNADGTRYRPAELSTNSDALVDVNYATNVDVSYVTGAGARQWMAVWNPWAYDSGWYWHMYNAGGASDNLVGIFAGRTSRAIAAGSSGVGIYNHTDPDAGLTVLTWLRGPDARLYYYATSYQTIRFDWGLFVGQKSTDLPADLNAVPAVNKQMNLHAGINLNKIANMTLEYPDPTPPFGQMYMERSILDGMISRCRTDNNYYNYLRGAEGYAAYIIDMWHDLSGVKTHDCANTVTGLANTLLERYANQNGIYDFQYHYWMGGVEMHRKADAIDQAIPNEYITTEDKDILKASASFFANMLWDDDFVPMQTDANGVYAACVNMGTANMPVQQTSYRDTYALFLSSHPTMTPHVPEVADRVHSLLNYIVNDYGAEMGSAHYTGASVSPVLNLELQQRMIGQTNPFATEPKLAKFAEFYLNLMTPKEVRFGGKRKLVAVGDGSTEGTSLYGELATGFNGLNDTLKSRLIGGFNAMGKPHSGFFGSTLFRINEDTPVIDPNLGNATFPGWCSVLRNAWDTDNESSIHFVNGDFYSDHRHADHGMVTMYALGAPLSIDWGPIYYPQVPGGYQHSMVIPEANIGAAWDADNSSFSAGGYGIWSGSTQDQFTSLPRSGRTVAHFTSSGGTVWTRNVSAIHPNAALPVLLIKDTFTGTGATNNKVFTMNLMAQGSVTTPAGPVTPISRFYNYYQGQYQYPSNGTVYALGAGLNQFTFTGQQFGTAGVTPAIDWDLFTIPDGAQDFFIGNWGHNWHPSPEQAQFQAANGRAFEETQHILRLRSGGAFTVLMLPYRKGQAPTRSVVQQGGTVVITCGNETTNINEANYSYQKVTPNVTTSVVSTFDGTPASAYGLSIEGGSTEVVSVGTHITITAHGAAGTRLIGVPADTWTVESGSITWNGTKWEMPYAGGDPATAVLVNGDNNLPEVALTAPAGGATFLAPASVAMSATAEDSDGSIARVEFYAGVVKVGEDTTAPYAFTWNDVPQGFYSITAKAIDNQGGVTTSTAAQITVNPGPNWTLVASPSDVSLTNTSSKWSRGSLITLPAAALKNGDYVPTVRVEYDLSHTATGDYDGWGVTIYDPGTTPYVENNWQPSPNVPGTVMPVGSSIAVYGTGGWNIFDSYPNQGVLWINAASATSNGRTAYKMAANTTYHHRVDVLQQGTRIECAIDQAGTPIASWSFDRDITGIMTNDKMALHRCNNGAQTSYLRNIRIYTGNTPPTVSLTAPTEGAEFPAGGQISLAAQATDIDGAVTRVEFYQETTYLGEDTLAPYTFDWPNVPAGEYSLTAKAYDNNNEFSTSTAVHISVVNSNVPPTVSITNPANNAVLLANSLTIDATAADSDGTVTKVEFYQNGAYLGEDAIAPYSYAWPSVAAGAYTLTAKAYDNQQAMTESSPVQITVWNKGDIGNVGQAGSAGYSAPTFTVTGAGAGITSTADGCYFVYKQITGDCTIIARVASFSSNRQSARAGVMIRETLDANAKEASSLFMPASNRVYFHRRTTTGGSTSTSYGSAAAPPYWVKLVRTGNVFAAYKSANGTSWTQVGSNVTITMGTTVYIGLAVTSGTTGTTKTATFDNVAVTAP